MNDAWIGYEDLIRCGDIVNVNFNNSQYTLCSEGKVMAIPGSPGDSWIIKDLKTNKLHYISEGCTITKELPNNYET